METILKKFQADELVNTMLGGPIKLVKKEPINLHEILITFVLVCSDSGREISIEKKYQPPIFLRGDRMQLFKSFLIF